MCHIYLVELDVNRVNSTKPDGQLINIVSARARVELTPVTELPDTISPKGLILICHLDCSFQVFKKCCLKE